MTDPTCRTCYYNTLDESARERFLAEPVTMPVHYCPEHQKAFDNMLSSFKWDHVIVHGHRYTHSEEARWEGEGGR